MTARAMLACSSMAQPVAQPEELALQQPITTGAAAEPELAQPVGTDLFDFPHEALASLQDDSQATVPKEEAAEEQMPKWFGPTEIVIDDDDDDARRLSSRAQLPDVIPTFASPSPAKNVYNMVCPV